MSFFRFFGVFFATTCLFVTGFSAQINITEEFSSPLIFCGEKSWTQHVNYYIASDNHQHIYLSYPESKNQLTKFSLQDKEIIWRTSVEGDILSVFDSIEKDKIQVLSSNNFSLFFTNFDIYSGIGLSQSVYSKTDSIVLNSIDKKESILFNKTSLQSSYFGKTVKNSDSISLIIKNFGASNFQIVGELVYFLENNKIRKLDLQRPVNVDSFSPNNKTGITETKLSAEGLVIGFNNGEVSALRTDFRELWKKKTGGKIRFIKETKDHYLVVSDDNFIYLFTKKGGNLVWKFRNKNRLLVSPAIIGNNIFVIDALENNLKILSLQKGIVINQVYLEQKKIFDGEVIYRDKKLYILLSDRILYYSISKC